MTTAQTPLFTLQGSDITVMTSLFSKVLFFPHRYLLTTGYNDLSRHMIFDYGIRQDTGVVPDNLMPNVHAVYTLHNANWDWFISPPLGNNTDNYQLETLIYNFTPHPPTDAPITARFYHDKAELTILRIFTQPGCTTGQTDITTIY